MTKLEGWCFEIVDSTEIRRCWLLQYLLNLWWCTGWRYWSLTNKSPILGHGGWGRRSYLILRPKLAFSEPDLAIFFWDLYLSRFWKENIHFGTSKRFPEERPESEDVSEYFDDLNQVIVFHTRIKVKSTNSIFLVTLNFLFCLDDILRYT